MIRIGRIGSGTKVHMHIDSKTCGAGRGAKLTEVIASDMLQWVKPAELCKCCFTANRIERASQINAYGRGWSGALEYFLNRIPVVVKVERTPVARLAQIKAELKARFRAEGVTVAA